MKVTQEIVTVWAEPETDEINIVLAGMRITLNSEETSLLVSGLAKALERSRPPPGRDAGDAPSILVRKDESGGAPSPDSDPMQLRTRALIQASIRDKGLSLREEPRS
jgi:hypothetical protein